MAIQASRYSQALSSGSGIAIRASLCLFGYKSQQLQTLKFQRVI